MASPYKAEYPPNVSVDADIVQFFEAFYRVSDTAGAHEQYVDMLTEEATFIMASKRCRGRDGTSPSAWPGPTLLTCGEKEILPARMAMWTAVDSRRHTISKIVPFASGAHEFFIYGVVSLGLKSGGKPDVDWAARAELVKSAADGRWRMKFYQVYLLCEGESCHLLEHLLDRLDAMPVTDALEPKQNSHQPCSDPRLASWWSLTWRRPQLVSAYLSCHLLEHLLDLHINRALNRGSPSGRSRGFGRDFVRESCHLLEHLLDRLDAMPVTDALEPKRNSHQPCSDPRLASWSLTWRRPQLVSAYPATCSSTSSTFASTVL
ncbi:hypothetical protein DCS_06062 [Drechmeria coniospora]|uniref:Uncharacterized protein n=1 Tax=Drechmeria coniospora TaxID=98403 RepID=A0A151GAI4_DRECN|nr:hypothetical protein DCS_06062 [Drechmeria coniospora]KYK54106.1 hypothetical protein DCS_06062 [Drechmeria coniospora]